MIPKKLHFVWIGDESKRPDNCIQSWVKLNPDYEIIIWGNTELSEYPLVTNKRAWKTVGPQLITDVHKQRRYNCALIA
jgi:mannosyltransferase OCH1-like enzyme